MAAAIKLNEYAAQLLRDYTSTAYAAGVTQEQIERFVKAGYVAQPHQLQLHALARSCDLPDGPEMIGFGGSRGPGKTHATLAQVGLDDCQRVEGLKFLFLRKVAKSGKESFEDVRRRLFVSIATHFRDQAGILEFPNGSRIVLGHFQNESDIDKYLGIEYDGAAIEEATQLSWKKVQLLRGSIRTSKRNWRPRLYLTTNPGGIGHQWFRKTFVLPFRSGEQTETRFLPAFAHQNMYLNPEYRNWLKSLDGALGKMWRDGDWDVAGGAFFTNWQHATHVIPWFEVPSHWRVWLAMDYGFQHWNVIYLFAQDDDGVVYILDEHAERRWLIPQHARAVHDMLTRNNIERHRIQRFVAGHDCFAKRHDGTTIADQWREHGWSLVAAVIDRLQGAAEWLRRLGNKEAGIEPTVFVTQRCPRLIDTMPMLLSDAKRPEDVLKVDTDENGNGGDDPYDTSRYGLMDATSTNLLWSFG